MKAWQVTRLGEPVDVLEWTDVPAPPATDGALRVAVEAVALNFPDVLLCRGEYQDKPELPFTPGAEVCGRIVDGPRAGERVLAAPQMPHGGLAEQVVVAPHRVFAIPDDLPAEKAASMLITYQTGYVGLHTRARLEAGEWLLVHAGAGGVGSAAIQIGKAAGARVIATAGGPDKVRVCRDLGADVVVDYLADDFVPVVKEVTGGAGADVVYDSVGGDVFDKSRKCVAFEGRIVVVGFAGGRIAQAPTNHALIKNYSVVGLYWGLYHVKKPAVIARTHERLVELWHEGKVDPLVSEVLPMSAAPSALASLGDRRTVGKVVLVNNPS
ncbi:NADPH:quinone oxidoreductase family protein [Micromonospora sp. WMMD998]|uniref:NADPH:quinone oxidoreductase family protein n=1 Tax=Micromonospora sp. WMMD998 TaxID=3016092 RepID=UPI00249B2BE4|nr:NADPH:quinone oxidoreductase family protein [Micromonospora sp. WMMD998]WFE40965.1 NADPH:quinone oxidoreductase family protein [Micromonospora sp. WMMD998]